MTLSPERTLWLGVIEQQFIDAGTEIGGRTRRRLEKMEAREWLLNDTRGLRVICEHAEVNHHLVMREARRRAAIGWPTKRTAIGKEGRQWPK